MGSSECTTALFDALGGAGFTARVSGVIIQDMWQKSIVVSTVAGITLAENAFRSAGLPPGRAEANVGELRSYTDAFSWPE